MQALNYGMAKKGKAHPKPKPRLRTFFREWRKHRGLTLEAAAERAGMTAGNLSAMERKVQGYTQAGLEALADAYNCDPGQLLNVDPTKDAGIWSIWETAKPGERQMIVNIAKTVTGKTGTND